MTERVYTVETLKLEAKKFNIFTRIFVLRLI